MKKRIVFMGSPDFALPTLEELIKWYNVVGVVTQPDKPAGRGKLLTPPPVKTMAEKLNIPIIQPHRLREESAMTQLRDWQPELIIVAAFGQLLRPDVLCLPKYGCINVHASLLPLWRGASPISAAILHGDHETGITIMKMDSGMDTGDILAQKSININDNDTTGSLTDKLSILGAELLLETLPDYWEGKLMPKHQDDDIATYASKIEKSAGELDFSLDALKLSRQVRALHPWPGAYMTWKGNILKIHQALPIKISSPGAGKHTVYQKMPAIGTGEGILSLNIIQPSGKKPMPGDVFLRGAKDWLLS